jgi:hypothetical protein
MSHQRNQYFGALHLVCVSNLNSTTINGAPHLNSACIISIQNVVEPFICCDENPSANGFSDAQKRQSRKIFVAKKTIKAGKVQRTGISHQIYHYFGALHLVGILQHNGYNYQRCAAPKNACIILPVQNVVEPFICCDENPSADGLFDSQKRQSRKIFVAKKTIKAGKVQRNVAPEKPIFRCAAPCLHIAT